MAQQKAKTANHHTWANDNAPGLQATHTKATHPVQKMNKTTIKQLFPNGPNHTGSHLAERKPINRNHELIWWDRKTE